MLDYAWSSLFSCLIKIIEKAKTTYEIIREAVVLARTVKNDMIRRVFDI
jgi:hypothetical protein